MIRKIDPGQAGLQGTLFGKRNFDNVWSLRVGVSVAELMAKDTLRPIDPVALNRDWTFDSRVTEFSALMEFNFLDYVNNYSEFRYSPYAFFGLTSDFLDKLDRTLPPPGASPADAKILNFGNPYTKDWYYSLGLTLSYTLTKARCYTD